MEEKFNLEKKKVDSSALLEARKKAEEVFAEFEKFTTENPNKPIPQSLEAKNRLAEENVRRAERGEAILTGAMGTGQERAVKISGAFGDARKKMSSWFHKTGKMLGSGAEKTIYGALGSPQAVKTGMEYTGKKFMEGANALGNEAELLGESVEKYVLNPISKQYELTKKSVVEDYQNTKKWAVEKKTATKDFVVFNAELGKDIAVFLTNQSVEGLKNVKDGMVQKYNKLVQYGENSINSGILRAQEAKNKYVKKFHTFMKNRHEKKAFKHSAKMEQYMAKIAQYNKVEEFEYQLGFA
jgi:hypothetical protein